MQSETKHPAVSFVIPAHNEEAMLPSVLRAIHDAGRELNAQLDVEYEAIVTNDASTDRTAEVAREHGARVVNADCRQIAGSRNAGARASHGKFILFVDADTWVNAPAVIGAVHAMQNGAVGGGSAFSFDRPVPLYARILEPICIVLYRMIRFASGSFIFCTRDAFDAVGGFDETLYASEEAFMSRSLRRHGRFVLLKHSVVTSGRKLRSYRARELFSTLFRLGLRPSRLREREGLDIWYNRRP
jgi:glycosyltransferase involved in cell wall biosynthesis